MSIKLPNRPVLRLMIVGTQCLGGDWKTALAKACGGGTTPRMVKYWAQDHCPEDLDARLLVAIDNMIAANHEKHATLADFRQQIVARLS